MQSASRVPSLAWILAPIALVSCSLGGGGPDRGVDPTGVDTASVEDPTVSPDDLESGSPGDAPADVLADACLPSCDGKQCGSNGCSGTCGGCPEGLSCTAEGTCAGLGCLGEPFEIDGAFETSVSAIEFDTAAAKVFHKMDIDPAEDGCIGMVTLDLWKGTGCRLHVKAAGAFTKSGGLRVKDLQFVADSQCPEFPDGKEGTYEDIGGLSVAEIVLGIDRVPGQDEAETCLATWVELKLAGGLHSSDAATDIEVASTTIGVTGDFLSKGDAGLPCPCVPDCSGQECGTDGCGGECGACAGTLSVCKDGTCICVPDCGGKECGPNGCGGDCGTCLPDQTCSLESKCVAGPCVPSCIGKECGSDGCKDTCGACMDGWHCDPNGKCKVGACAPQCTGKECGPDGCEGTCGDCGCGEVCQDGLCSFTACDGKECGDDGCGSECGTCGCGEECTAGKCEFNACDGKVCGDDGCGAECGTCPLGQACFGGECIDVDCGANPIVVDGEFLTEVTVPTGGVTTSSIVFNTVTAAVVHKRDVDEFEDGCVTEVVLTFKKGTGCSLVVTAGVSFDLGGRLVVQAIEFEADSQCPGFPDATEGFYTGEATPLGATVDTGVTDVPGNNVPESCFQASMVLSLGGSLMGDEGQVLKMAGKLTVSGDFVSAGDFSAKCPCRPSCVGKECGDAGCGFECGQCADDGNTCTGETCVGGHCEHQPLTGTPCDDGSVCTLVDSCAAGVCVGAGILGCDDGIPCTDDTCDLVKGCQHADNALPCASAKCDGAKFYAAVNCSGGTCPEQTGVTCDDGKLCTTDACDPAMGCVYANNAVAACPAVSGFAVSCDAQQTCEYLGGNGSPMVYVPAGPFWMGGNKDGTQCPTNTLEAEAEPAAIPCHQVAMPGFLVDKFETTVADYQACNTAAPGTCTAPGTDWHACNWQNAGKEQHPLNCVTWFQMDGYCKWAGKRLCSESEWEKAARGTDGRLYPWGNQAPTCQFAVTHCGTWTWEVGKKTAGASPYGAMDMAGNVWEWVKDDWHGSYAGAPVNGGAWVDSPRGSDRVLRGGSFYGPSSCLRASFRTHLKASQYVLSFDYAVGARCCKSL